MAWERRGWCRSCRRHVLGKYVYGEPIREGTLLTITCGLYLPVFLWKMTRRRWACPRCGEILDT